MKQLISKRKIIATVAFYAIYQSPYIFPDNLEKALSALSEQIDKRKIFKSKDESSLHHLTEMTYEETKKLIRDLIFNIPEISIWNVSKKEQDEGITAYNDKKRKVLFCATSRYGNMQSADNSFIDLDALCSNICQELYVE